MRSQRGAAIVETALSVTVGLLFVFGGLQLGIIGYQQVSADGAAFISQHVGDQFGDGYSAATATYSTVHKSDLNYSPHPSATPSGQMIDYGYANTSNRHGGATVTGAVSVETVARRQMNYALPFVSQFLGTTLQGDAVSQFQAQEGPGWNVAGALNPDQLLADSASWTWTNDTTPPYFVSRNYMMRCMNTYPWDTCKKETEYAYSVAEYLDADNWWRPDAGVQPQGSSTFYEIPCHQRAYASWVAKLPATYPDPNTTQRDALLALFNPAHGTLAPDPDMAKIRGWEVTDDTVTNFVAAPLTPAAGC